MTKIDKEGMKYFGLNAVCCEKKELTEQWSIDINIINNIFNSYANPLNQNENTKKYVKIWI